MEQIAKDIKQIFSTEQGLRVLRHLQGLSNHSWPRLDNPIDPYRLAYDEGQRSVICYIIKMVESKLNSKLEESNEVTNGKENDA